MENKNSNKSQEEFKKMLSKYIRDNESPEEAKKHFENFIKNTSIEKKHYPENK